MFRKISSLLVFILAFSFMSSIAAPAANAFFVPAPRVQIVFFKPPSPKALGELDQILRKLQRGQISITVAISYIQKWAMKYGVTNNKKWNALVQSLLGDLFRLRNKTIGGVQKHREGAAIIARYLKALTVAKTAPATLFPSIQTQLPPGIRLAP